jgi:hypothetical protein
MTAKKSSYTTLVPRQQIRKTQQCSHWEAVLSKRSVQLLRDVTIEVLGDVFHTVRAKAI